MNTVVTVKDVESIPTDKRLTNRAGAMASRRPVRVPDELAAVWVQLLSSSWTSLALVPASKGAEADGLSSAFDAMVARCCDGATARVIDLRGKDVDAMPELRAELQAATGTGTRLLLLVDDPAVNPLSQAILRIADVAALLLCRGETTAEQADAAAEACPRLLGGVMLT